MNNICAGVGWFWYHICGLRIVNTKIKKKKKIIFHFTGHSHDSQRPCRDQNRARRQGHPRVLPQPLPVLQRNSLLHPTVAVPQLVPSREPPKNFGQARKVFCRKRQIFVPLRQVSQRRQEWSCFVKLHNHGERFERGISVVGEQAVAGFGPFPVAYG